VLGMGLTDPRLSSEYDEVYRAPHRCQGQRAYQNQISRSKNVYVCGLARYDSVSMLSVNLAKLSDQ
jgi:hypothetical protein